MSIMSRTLATPRPRRRSLETLCYAGGLVFAMLVALFTGEDPVRVWAPFAVLGCVVGLAVVTLASLVPPLARLRRRADWLLPGVVAMLVTVVPLGYEAAVGVEVIEVGILQRGAARWLRTGSPYPSVEVLATATEAADYNVYFPLLVLSGIPAALLGDSVFTDARWFLLLAAVAVLWTSTRSVHGVLVFCALPPVGMVAAAGMTDLLPITLVCAAIIQFSRAEPVRAGLLVGLAAGAKLLAWPAIPVLFMAFRRGLPRMLGGYVVAVLATMIVTVGTPALVAPEAFWRNTFALPLALEPVTLVARTPLPGYLLSASGSSGRGIALLLLLIAALGMLAWLLVRPPVTVLEIALRLAIGWTLLFSLAPATRIGYFVFPILVLAWVLIRLEERRPADPVLHRSDADLVDRSAR